VAGGGISPVEGEHAQHRGRRLGETPGGMQRIAEIQIEMSGRGVQCDRARHQRHRVERPIVLVGGKPAQEQGVGTLRRLGGNPAIEGLGLGNPAFPVQGKRRRQSGLMILASRVRTLHRRAIGPGRTGVKRAPGYRACAVPVT
jgi:hypothetical protein